METLVKQTREVGTSAGVLLPRSWLNKQVLVTLLEPSKEKIFKDITEIIIKYSLNEEIKGIYLYGSYARGDYDEKSDIDVLIITNTLNKLISENNYEIIFVSEESFSKNLQNNLNYLSFLNELKVILNSNLIEKYKNKNIRPNYKIFLNEIQGILNINKDSVKFCKDNNQNVPDGIVYSLVLRLRELYLIKSIRSKKQYSKQEFLRKIGDKINSAYLRIKRNEREVDNVFPEELNSLIEISEKWLKELKD
jgi:predicted nucleotidyltransferase